MVVKPTITVCIPVYNGEKFIVDAVNSALAQEYTPLEILVVDNCSSDGTLEAISSESDSRLKIVAEKDFVGMAENWDRAAGMATGDFVLMLSADDCLEPRAISSLVAPLLRDPECGLVLGRPKHLDESGDRPFGVALRAMPPGPVTELESFVIHYTPAININAILFKQGLVKFRPSAGLVCDLDLLLNLGQQGQKAFVLDQEVLAYREHPDALSTDRIRMWRETTDCYVHNLSKSQKPRAYRWRLFKTLFWFGSHVRGNEEKSGFSEKYKLTAPHLSGWQRALLKLAGFPIFGRAVSRLRNLVSRLPKPS